MANLIVEAVPAGQTGVATGMNTIVRTIGGAIGAEVAASVLADGRVNSISTGPCAMALPVFWSYSKVSPEIRSISFPSSP